MPADFSIHGRVVASHEEQRDGQTVRVVDELELTHLSIDPALLEFRRVYQPGKRRDIDDYVDALRSVVDPHGWAKLWLTPSKIRARLIRAAERYDIGGYE